MRHFITLFVSTFTTLLAIINPLEALPVFLGMTATYESDGHRRKLARRACLYAALLMFFFLVFGTLVLKVFGVSLSMVRIVGGIVLMRIGFELFSGPTATGSMLGGGKDGGDPAFVPLAMPLMVGPGAIATTLGMISLVRSDGLEIIAFLTIAGAIAVTMLTTFYCLAYARRLVGRIGANGIDAITRIVGFFVAAMGGGLIFHGLVEALQDYGLIAAK
jgi:multiple antibiotic resistance protein